MADTDPREAAPHGDDHPFRRLGPPPRERIITTQTYLRCGYPLRGLPPDGNCPECGLAVERSLLGLSLRHANARYIRTMHHGFVIAQWSVGIGLAAMFLLFAAVGGSLLTFPIFGVFVMVFAATVASTLAGWWMATTADPALPPSRNHRTLRWLIRATLLGGYFPPLAIATAALIPAASNWLWTLAQSASPLTALAVWIAPPAIVTAFVARIAYIRWLATRLPNQLLGSQATATAWTIAIVSILGAPMCLMGPLIGTLLWLHLLDETRRSLRDAADIAERREAQTDPAPLKTSSPGTPSTPISPMFEPTHAQANNPTRAHGCLRHNPPTTQSSTP